MLIGGRIVLGNDLVEYAPNVEKYILFPTHIYYSKLSDTEHETDRLLQRIYRERRNDPEGIIRSNAKNTDSWHSKTDIHEWDETGFLINQILLTSHTIFEETKYDPNSYPILNNMWANISPTHGFNKTHIHPHSLWSGVYYLQTPDNCGDIIFTDPRYSRAMFTPGLSEGEADYSEMDTYTFYARRYVLILFPSYLMHEVEPNGSTAERVSISFNINQAFN